MTKTHSISLWPATIIGFFAVFISFLVGFGIFASRQRVDLVRPDYYEHEIRFQQHIDKVQRTQALQGEASISYQPTRGQVRIHLPSGEKIESGSVNFYRPSNASLDHEISLRALLASAQPIDVSKLAPGFWKVRVTWKAAGQEYHLEKSIVLTETP
jgi:nitrogen fixation protein FixH